MSVTPNKPATNPPVLPSFEKLGKQFDTAAKKLTVADLFMTPLGKEGLKMFEKGLNATNKTLDRPLSK
jgi:hypothetical protein